MRHCCLGTVAHCLLVSCLHCSRGTWACTCNTTSTAPHPTPPVGSREFRNYGEGPSGVLLRDCKTLIFAKIISSSTILCTAPGCTAAAGWRSTSARAPASPRSRTAAAAPPGTPAATPGCNTTKYFCTFLQIFSTRPIFAWLPETICTAKRPQFTGSQSKAGMVTRPGCGYMLHHTGPCVGVRLVGIGNVLCALLWGLLQ